MRQLEGWSVLHVRVGKWSPCATEPGARGAKEAIWGEVEGPGLPVFCRWGSGSQEGFKERRRKNSGCEGPD